MAGLVYFTVIFISMLDSCHCSSSTGAMQTRIRNFNKKVNSFRMDLAEMDTNLHESIDIATDSLRQELTEHFKQQIEKKLKSFKVEIYERDTSIHESIDITADSLRQELTKHFKQQIQEAKEEFRRDESVPNVPVVRTHVDSQVNRLKKGQQNMKRQLQRVMESLRHVQQEKDLYRDAFFKAERRIAESCYKCASDSHLLSNVLKKSNGSVQSHSENELFNLQKLNVSIVNQRFNSTNAEEIEDSFLTPLSTTTTTTTTISQSTATTTTTISPSSTTTMTTISSSISTKISPLSTTTTTISPSTTSATVQPTPVMNRLLTASWSGSEILQLNIHSRSSTKYSLNVSGGVTALCYIHRLQRLLVVTYEEPKMITSTSLDGDDTRTLREGVWVKGMVVDEGREHVFMTTGKPRYSISRISTRGDNFTIIRNLTGGYSHPIGIAVNTKQREVYVGSYANGRVFSLSYDGKVLKTLVSAYAVDITFDSVRNTLYFNDWNTLKKISDGVVSDVTSLMKTPSTLAYYNNTVYYGGEYGTRYVGAVRLGENIVETRLHTLSSIYNEDLIICLVP